MSKKLDRDIRLLKMMNRACRTANPAKMARASLYWAWDMYVTNAKERYWPHPAPYPAEELEKKP